MKGMVFIGCSFTWGHGLWYYSELDSFGSGPENFHKQYKRSSLLNYKNSISFPRLVANHFETFEITKKFTGGDERQSLKFLDLIFNHDLNDGFYSDEKYDYNEVDYVILQTSCPLRNKLLINGIEIDSFKIGEGDEFYHELKNNDIEDINHYIDLLTNQLYDEIKTTFNILESNGIKCKILNWSKHYDKLMLNDSWGLDRVIKLNYKNKTYNSIDEMVEDDNEHLWMGNDREFFGDDTPNDLHPSKLCHKILAKSIIESIKNGRVV
jgi:hypothetical protein